MKDVMPRRQAQLKRPLTLGDFDKGLDDCADVATAAGILRAQVNAMKAAK